MRRERNGRKSGSEELIGGITLVAIFGLLYFSTHQWFWLFPLCFAGLPALLRGIQRIYSQRALTRQRRVDVPQTTDSDRTKEILRVAQVNNGIVTPALVSLNSSLSLEDAERLLQELTSKGYANMNVTESGRIEYEFPEFYHQVDEIE